MAAVQQGPPAAWRVVTGTEALRRLRPQLAVNEGLARFSSNRRLQQSTANAWQRWAHHVATAAGLSGYVSVLARGRRNAGMHSMARMASVGPEAPASKTENLAVYSLLLHQQAREAVVARMQKEGRKEGVLFFNGGEDAVRHDTDHEDVFRQESTFHYLFGVREPGYAGAIDLAKGTTTLFAPRLPPEYALWMGRIKSLDRIKEHYGVSEVVYEEDVVSWFQSNAPKKIYVQRGENSDSGREVMPAEFPDMRESYDVDEEVLHDVVYQCRARKNEEEIRLLRYVNRISSDAHLAMMRQAKPGMREYQLESMFAYYCHYNGGCRHLSYTPIAGSGPNAAVLHYGHAGAPNDRKMEDGDIVLCDMGSELYCYASDITNSFPVSGTFTADQRIIFETVAAMQSAVLGAMKPGVKWIEMHELAYQVMCEKLVEAGLLVGKVKSMMSANVPGVLMPHGLGHFMGIDTHDVGGYPKDAKRDTRDGYNALRAQVVLEPGHVLTVEPGIYFMEYALQEAKQKKTLSKFFNWDRIADFESFGGVRLEDNVLVTESGIENFTTAPRTVDEVEAVMRGEVADSVALIQRRSDALQGA